MQRQCIRSYRCVASCIVFGKLLGSFQKYNGVKCEQRILCIRMLTALFESCQALHFWHTWALSFSQKASNNLKKELQDAASSCFKWSHECPIHVLQLRWWCYNSVITRHWLPLHSLQCPLFLNTVCELHKFTFVFKCTWMWKCSLMSLYVLKMWPISKCTAANNRNILKCVFSNSMHLSAS